MSKAADAFRTISEVADELDVPKHVLRFWEAKFSHIRPMKRGGGRRYYRPEDMELLRGIRHLLHLEGLTIKGVQKILREQGVDGVKRWGRPDADEVAAVTPPLMAVTVAPDEAPTVRNKRKSIDAKASKPVLDAQTRAAIRAAIVELERCRDMLRGAPAVASAAAADDSASKVRRTR